MNREQRWVFSFPPEDPEPPAQESILDLLSVESHLGLPSVLSFPWDWFLPLFPCPVSN